jgi:S-adenosylmethionine:tRNA ribosyltransferase-isomerase
MTKKYILTDFDFELPPELIAQHPSQERDHSNLLIAHQRNNYQIRKFFDIEQFLNPGDILVFNNSRVINAQLLLNKDNAAININLNRPLGPNKWLAFARPSKKINIGDMFLFDDHRIIVTNKFEFGEIELEFHLQNLEIFDFLDKYGSLPLPPYIKRSEGVEAQDKERYQNIYSSNPGAVAAPTAGLHFTQKLLEQLQHKGIETCFVTLHVGAGTFLPVKTEDITQHKMHSEWCQVSPDVADKINKAKQEKRRVIAVGTTSLRTLESCAIDGVLQARMIDTDIFITPGYDFQIIDGLITNFHLPKSTLFMLICAIMGFEEAHAAYQYAIENHMRFFSYGDSMFILRQ